jgi:ABC-2 type transport system ATP-binding protein
MIELTDISFAYSRKQTPLFSHLNCQLPAGTICGLLGANGAGKSSLLRLLAGLSFPQQGSCRVLGNEPGRREPKFLADVFLLPEEVSVPALLPATYAARFGSLYPKFDQALFAQLQAEFSLPVAQKLTQYSHGQKKKFLLAFGLATQASLLILDEPTNGLDIPSKQQFRKALINHYSAERSFLISTHQVHDLQGLIDAVLIIDNGKVLLHASLDALASCLSVELLHERPHDALYAEESLEGFRVIRANTRGMESNIDLSLLFGCVLAQPLLVQSLLSHVQQGVAA